MIASTIANVQPRKRGAKPLKPNDFYPQLQNGKKSTSRLIEKLRQRKRAKAKDL